MVESPYGGLTKTLRAIRDCITVKNTYFRATCGDKELPAEPKALSGVPKS